MRHFTAGNMHEAELQLRNALRHAPQDFDATHLSGVVALQSGQVQRAITLLERAVNLRITSAHAHANLGTAHAAAKNADLALQCYRRAFELDPRFFGALNNTALLLQRLGRHEAAAAEFKRLNELSPRFDFALGSSFHERRYAGDWTDFNLQCEAVIEGVEAGWNADRPFSFLSVCDSGTLQLQCARTHAAYLIPKPFAPLWKGERYSHEKLRIAYVSADFRAHIAMRLLQPIIALHDRSRFHIIGVSLMAGDGSATSELARQSVDQFMAAGHLSDEQIARMLREAEVDVAVDLTGYTRGARPAVFARRPAPVQVNFFGYPGSLGAPWVDYIIADAFVAPTEHREFFSEEIVRLPDTFQANGRRAADVAKHQVMDRSAAGLPLEAVVLCCFNNTYKINPESVDAWSTILRAAPSSVMWLLSESESVEARLRSAFQERGVNSERLIFAGRIRYAEHLQRLQLADLFLDTLPFNAGVTAADALWAGVPVITCAGESFASRMAGSVLTAAGLPELIARGRQDYCTLGIELARDPARLATLKARLLSERLRLPLFDDVRFCQNLEIAFEEMCRRTSRGESPESFDVANIDSSPLAAR